MNLSLYIYAAVSLQLGYFFLSSTNAIARTLSSGPKRPLYKGHRLKTFSLLYSQQTKGPFFSFSKLLKEAFQSFHDIHTRAERKVS